MLKSGDHILSICRSDDRWQFRLQTNYYTDNALLNFHYAHIGRIKKSNYIGNVRLWCKNRTFASRSVSVLPHIDDDVSSSSRISDYYALLAMLKGYCRPQWRFKVSSMPIIALLGVSKSRSRQLWGGISLWKKCKGNQNGTQHGYKYETSLTQKWIVCTLLTAKFDSQNNG